MFGGGPAEFAGGFGAPAGAYGLPAAGGFGFGDPDVAGGMNAGAFGQPVPGGFGAPAGAFGDPFGGGGRQFAPDGSSVPKFAGQAPAEGFGRQSKASRGSGGGGAGGSATAHSDAISDLAFSPAGDGRNYLLAAVWDGEARVSTITSVDKAELVASIRPTEDGAPLLCCAWSADGQRAVLGGCDNALRSWDVASGAVRLVGQHAAPIRCVTGARDGERFTHATGSWDKTVRFWDERTGTEAVHSLEVSERVFAMSAVGHTLVVATANRKNHVIDLRNPSRVDQTMSSPLTSQTRCIAVFPDEAGFVVGGLEARCGVQVFGDVSKNFTFKCHRVAPARGEAGATLAYPLNGLSFHPSAGSFVTTGGDGGVCLWDKEKRQRLKKLFQPAVGVGVGRQASRPEAAPTGASAFSHDGKLLAVAVGQNEVGHKESEYFVRIHATPDSVVKSRRR